jgi:hypothetical protein
MIIGSRILSDIFSASWAAATRELICCKADFE